MKLWSQVSQDCRSINEICGSDIHQNATIFYFYTVYLTFIWFYSCRRWIFKSHQESQVSSPLRMDARMPLGVKSRPPSQVPSSPSFTSISRFSVMGTAQWEKVKDGFMRTEEWVCDPSDKELRMETAVDFSQHFRKSHSQYPKTLSDYWIHTATSGTV